MRETRTAEATAIMEGTPRSFPRFESRRHGSPPPGGGRAARIALPASLQGQGISLGSFALTPIGVLPHMGGGLPNVIGRLDFGDRLGYSGLPEGQAAIAQRSP